MRESVFIHCWHRSHDDSAAMWASYGKSECAVAPTTTVGQLADTLEGMNQDHTIRVARVDYVKHWSDPKLDISPDYARIFTYKTKAYESEKEVRVIIDRTRRSLVPELLQTGVLVPVRRSKLATDPI